MGSKNRAQCVCSILCFLFLLCCSQGALAQSVGEDIDIVNVNDWGSGFNATFSYTIDEEDVVDDLVRDWRIEIDYSGSGSIGNPYMSGYSGSILSGNIGPNDGFAITNEGVGYRPELDQGFALTFTIQGQGSGFSSSDFDIRFVNLTVLPTNNFTASLVTVNDWYNPSWGGGFNATFRCDVEGPDAQIGPVTDLLIEFNYTGEGTPSTAWTQSHNGPVIYGYIAPDGGYAISNVDGFQPELYAGDSITFAIQIQNAPFRESDFTITCSTGGNSENSNSAPVADDLTVMLEQDTAASFQLTANDTDQDTLTYSVIAEPSNGVLTGVPPLLSYTPSASFLGNDSLSFQVSDGTNTSNIATVAFEVSSRPNQAPIADAGEDVQSDLRDVITLFGQGTDPEGDTLTFNWSLVSKPSNSK